MPSRRSSCCCSDTARSLRLHLCVSTIANGTRTRSSRKAQYVLLFLLHTQTARPQELISFSLIQKSALNTSLTVLLVLLANLVLMVVLMSACLSRSVVGHMSLQSTIWLLICAVYLPTAICPDISIGCPPGFVSEPDPANVCENICVRIAKRGMSFLFLNSLLFCS